MLSPLGLAGAGVGALGNIAGGITNAFASEHAGKELSSAYNNYLNYAKGQYTTDQNNLAPYMSAGNAASTAYQQDLPSLTQGFNPTLQQLQQTPGYQFELTQGQNATNNAMAAQGLSGSGAELSALDNYSQGLANQTYQSLADIYNTNRQTTAGILNNGMQLGEGAANNLGQLGVQLTGDVGNAYAGIGGAEAGATMGQAAGISQAADFLGSSSGSSGS
jgi:hypothetical protein